MAVGQAAGQVRTGAADLLAFLGVLAFTGVLTLLVDHGGRLSARPAPG